MSVPIRHLKQALAIMGVSTPESLEEFRQDELKWINKLVFTVVIFGDEGAKSAVQPVVSQDGAAAKVDIIRPLIDDTMKYHRTANSRASKLLTALNISVDAVKEILKEWVDRSQ